MTRYYCRDEERRAAAKQGFSDVDGIDYLEVLDSDLLPGHPDLRQQLLVVRFLKGPLTGLGTDNVRIDGGVRVTPVRALWAMPQPDVAASSVPPEEKDAVEAFFGSGTTDDQALVVRTDSEGDYSSYLFRLVTAPDDPTPPTGLDPRLSVVEFSFKVECPSDFDCKTGEECPPPALDEPPIDYLAKDYESFRRLILDRMQVLAPEWTERNAADRGIAEVELLAYLGDRLSYRQDATATEAYIGTSRRRVSLRRHARLVDYRVHEGVNARAWVQITAGTGGDGEIITGPDAAQQPPLPGTRLSTTVEKGATTLHPDAVVKAVTEGAVVFEALHDLTVRAALDEIELYTWSDRECCLPQGATEATLMRPAPAGGSPNDPIDGLEPGAFLLFEEVKGPKTGAAADADPTRRHVVRLTDVEFTVDPLVPSAGGEPTPIVEIAWDAADALPFALCVSAVTDPEHGADYVENVSVARGNLLLADHGLSISGEELPAAADPDRPFRPTLEGGPLTHGVALPEGFPAEGPPWTPAAMLAGDSPRDALPLIQLDSADGERWNSRPDLLSSGRFDAHFVAELNEAGRATLRFGDGVHGMKPGLATTFTAHYRVGVGKGGNVGADKIKHVYLHPSAIESLRNPLPAFGGADAEPLEDVRQYAPQAFRVQQRAVTEDDYARAAARHPQVQEAAGTFRWTGSWYTAFVTADRHRGLPVDAPFERQLRDHLGFFRMAGYDLEVDGPRFVPLELRMHVCVLPGYPRSEVGRELLDVLSCRRLPDGRPGFFHPDNWTFGQPVYLSRIYAAVEGVAGVDSVSIEVFKRWGRLSQDELEQGVLPIGRLEIARLDNDPSFQENGLLELSMGGGR